jgi:hypothetical protein
LSIVIWSGTVAIGESAFLALLNKVKLVGVCAFVRDGGHEATTGGLAITGSFEV